MKRPINHFRIGLFVLLGLGVTLGGLIYVGAGEVFQPTRTYATFFSTSVGGLQKEAPVKYLGVKVGHVARIRIAPGEQYAEVLVKIDRSFRMPKNMILELGSEGIAGQTELFLQRSAAGEQIAAPKLPFTVSYPVLPNRPGGMAQLESQARKILTQLRQADIATLVAQWRKTAINLNRVLGGGELQRTLADLQHSAQTLRGILDGLGGGGREARWREVSMNLAATTAALRQATQRLDEQLQALPPQSLAKLARSSTRMVATGERAVGSLDRQLSQSLDLLQKSVIEVNRLLVETQRLVRSLRENPGRILEQRPSGEPFAR